MKWIQNIEIRVLRTSLLTEANEFRPLRLYFGPFVCRLVNVNPKTINYAITTACIIPRIAFRWRSTLWPRARVQGDRDAIALGKRVPTEIVRAIFVFVNPVVPIALYNNISVVRRPVHPRCGKTRVFFFFSIPINIYGEL